MEYGIIAAAKPNLSNGGAAYSASGVTFNSARLTLSSLVCTDNEFFGFAGWFKALWETGSPGSPFEIDPSSNFLAGHLGGYLEFSCGPNNTHHAGIDLYAEPPLAEDTWQHFIGCIETNHTSGTKIVKLYIDDVDIGGARTGVNYFDSTTGSFTIVCNGKPLWVGDGQDGKYTGSMSDVSIWPGISLLTTGDISEATRRLFIDAIGNPVDPAVAVAALGAPAVMLTGNATAFISNSMGTSGALTVAAGSLSNSATHP